MRSIASLLSGCLFAFAACNIARAAESRWSVEAGPAWWFNAKVSYHATPLADPSAAAGADRTYDDGYNRRDASGDIGDGAGGPLASRTGYFGYANSSQLDLSAGTLTMHQLQAAGDYVGGRRLGAQVAPHFAVRRSFSDAENGRVSWGLELSIDSVSLKDRASGSEAATLRLLSDAYPLGGVVPQNAPYAGRFTPSPGDQRIGDTPARTISTMAGTVTGVRAFDTRVWLYRFGPTLRLGGAHEWPSQRWSLHAQAGVALADCEATLNLDETVQAPNLPAGSHAATYVKDSWTKWGGFAGLRLRYLLSKSWAVGARVDLVSVGKGTVGDATRAATLDLSASAIGAVTVEYRW